VVPASTTVAAPTSTSGLTSTVTNATAGVVR
jgi:hypothetical protein